MTDAQAMIMAQEGSGPMRNGRFLLYDDATGKELKAGMMIVGNPTFGYGHNVQAKGISPDLVLLQLNTDLADALDDVRHCFSCYDHLTRPRQLALISMALNLGREGLAKFVRFIGAVHLGKYDEAADELLNSLAAKQAPARYQELAKMMRENTSSWV